MSAGWWPTPRAAGCSLRTWESVYVCVDDNSRAAYVEILDDELASTGVRQRITVRVQGVGRLVHPTEHPPPRTRPYRPRTNGKPKDSSKPCCANGPTPPSTRALSTEVARATTWIGYYNHRRSNGSLGKRPPASRLTAD